MNRSPLGDFYGDADVNGNRFENSAPARFRLIRNAAHLYRLRVREQPLQEVLAMFGIAAGVALLFAVQVATTSVTGAVDQFSRSISGKATVELASRGSEGMDQNILAKAQRLKDVQAAAPVLLQRITVVGPGGSQPLTLVGVDERLERIGGPLVHRFSAKRQNLGNLGLFLTSATATSIGASRGQTLNIETGDQKREVILAGVLGADEVGGLAKSPVALAPLGQAQRLANMPGHITRVLVQPKSGSAAAAQDELRALAGDRLDVRPSDSDAKFLGEAMKPDEQSSALFSAIAVVIGVLFAYNAMLLATSRRRRLYAYLRMLGADRTTVIATLIFEAVVLGLAASLIGIALGDVLSSIAFNSVPEYLATGFPIGSQRLISATTIALSIFGGLAAALLASAKPAIEVYRATPGDAVREPTSTGLGTGILRGATGFWLGLAVIATASVLVLVAPPLTPAGTGAVIVGLVLALGPALAYALSRLNRVTRVRGGIGMALAVDELAANTARATALAVIAASAMTAIVSIGGARLDLERGVAQLDRGLYASKALWITPGEKGNTFLTQPFDPRAAITRLKGDPDVAKTSVYRGSFLDVGQSRLRVVARPPDDPFPLVQSQVVRGDPQQAMQRIRSGGWVALFDPLARERGYKVGQRVVIPTPTGDQTFRLAATTTNYGWPAGGIAMNADDYERAWGNSQASAIALDLTSGISTNSAKLSVERALGPDSALRVQTADEMLQERATVLAQGLTRLRQISTLVLIAAMLAIIAAMFAAVWQRRTQLASLRAIGVYRSELYRTIFFETGLIVLLGGLVGLAFGTYCQIFASRWTEIGSGYHAPFVPAVGLGLVTLAKAMVLTALATAGPAYLAARVEPQTEGRG